MIEISIEIPQVEGVDGRAYRPLLDRQILIVNHVILY